MTRAWMILLAACGSTSDPASGAGSSTAQAGSGTVASNLAVNDPATAVIEKVFSKRPHFPLLSKDGRYAAVEIVTPVARSGGSTYSVGFVTAGADEWSGAEIDLTTLVDGMLLALLVETRESGIAPTYDVAGLTGQVKAITSRISEGGFAPFESVIEMEGTGKAAGPFRFKVNDDPSGAIAIDITEGAKTIKTEIITATSTGLIADVECRAKPRVKRAFVDATRRRLLLHIGWTVPAQCDPPDDKYRLYAPT